MISILISPVVAIDNQSNQNNTTYRTFVDQNHGFYIVYQVYDVTFGKVANYQNRTLNISRGDTITWINREDMRLTVISEQKLWDEKSGFLAWEYKEFNYTFTNPGIYDVYIKENPGLKQRIIVGPIESNLKIVTDVNNTPINEKLTTKTTAIKQNSTINKSNVPISISVSHTLYDNIKSMLDTILLVIVLLSMFVLSGRIKED